jgi:hypothetical protein
MDSNLWFLVARPSNRSWETGLLARKRERICWGTGSSNPSPSSGESRANLSRAPRHGGLAHRGSGRHGKARLIPAAVQQLLLGRIRDLLALRGIPIGVFAINRSRQLIVPEREQGACLHKPSLVSSAIRVGFAAPLRGPKADPTGSEATTRPESFDAAKGHHTPWICSHRMGFERCPRYTGRDISSDLRTSPTSRGGLEAPTIASREVR